MSTASDRGELVEILRIHAVDGLHVDDVTDRWRDFEADTDAIDYAERGTIFVGVWGDPNDDELIAQVGDSGHRGKVWITFAKGKHPARAAKFRQEVLSDVERRWPNAQMLPILPSGAIPFPRDLQMTPGGYKVKRSAAALYRLPASSPFVSQN